jgi:hypothetical protein
MQALMFLPFFLDPDVSSFMSVQYNGFFVAQAMLRFAEDMFLHLSNICLGIWCIIQEYCWHLPTGARHLIQTHLQSCCLWSSTVIVGYSPPVKNLQTLNACVSWKPLPRIFSLQLDAWRCQVQQAIVICVFRMYFVVSCVGGKFMIGGAGMARTLRFKRAHFAVNEVGKLLENRCCSFWGR